MNLARTRPAGTERIAALLEQLGDAAVLQSLDGQVLALNAAAVRLFRRSAEEALGRPAGELCFHPEISPGSLEAGPSRRVLAGVLPGGERLTVETTFSLWRDEGGAPLGILGCSRDVTGREAVLARHQVIFDLLPIGVICRDGSGRVVFANREAKQAFVHLVPDFSDCPGDSLLPLFREDGSRIRAEEYPPLVALRTGKPVESFVAGYRKGEETRWVKIRSLPVEGADASSRWVASLFDDVTDEVRIAAALENSEVCLSALMNASSESMILVAPDLTTLAANRVAAARNGFASPEEMLGKDGLAYLPPEVALRRKKIVEGVFASGRPVRVTAEAGGRTFSTGLEPVVGADARVRAVAIFSADVTERVRAERALQEAHRELERKVEERTERLARVVSELGAEIRARAEAERLAQESEARYRALTESLQDLVISADADGRLDYVGPQVSRLGFSPESLLGRDLLSLAPAGQREEVARMVQRLAAGEPVTAYNHARLPSGESCWLETNARPLSGPTGARAGFVCVVRDVTERVQALEEIRRSRDQLRALAAHMESVREEERRRIARELHDVLGQTLTGLKLETNLLDNMLSPDERGKAAVREQIDTINELVDSTVETVRRLSSELRPSSLEDLGLVATLDWMIREFGRRTGVACRLVCEMAECPLPLERATAAYRIVQEALTNVARHAKASQVEVGIACAGTHLLVEVHDDGVGITREQIDNPKALGLVGMRERALAVGGTVEVQPHPERGTLVRVILPGET